MGFRLIFNMGIPILVRRHLYNETAPWNEWPLTFRKTEPKEEFSTITFENQLLSKQKVLFEHVWIWLASESRFKNQLVYFREQNTRGKAGRSQRQWVIRHVTWWLVLGLLSWHPIILVNSLVPGRFGCDLKNSIFNFVLFKLIGILRALYDNALRWMTRNITDDQSTLVQVMAWCRQATSHYLGQCWSRSMSPYGVIMPKWVNST